MVPDKRLVLLLGSLVVLSQATSPSDNYYIAGVAEFQPASSDLDSHEQLADNLSGYLELIDSQQVNKTDIIVFPEGTLNSYHTSTYVPDSKENIALCGAAGYEDFLQAVSCRAMTRRKYVVINVIEKEDCIAGGRCSPEGLNLYNTNVVFDRNGVVVSRYRKWNLYKEPWNVTTNAELATFETDFGVTFGHFICFDILFYSPASELVKAGITDFIFPNMWFSQLPFLTGVQIQQSWAYSYDVNLLAAGASNPAIGNTGSGIYAGRQGPLISVMNSSPVRRLYVANVTKRSYARQYPSPALQLQRDYRIDEYTTAPIDTSQQSTRLCHDKFCCQFSIKARTLAPESGTSSYQYRYAVYSGPRPYTDMQPIYTRICTLFACTDDTLESCALAFDENVQVRPQLLLEEVAIEADFPATEKLLLMPNSVDSTLMPLSVDSFAFNITDNGEVKHVRYELLSARDNLMNFGIYANYFNGYSSAVALLVSKSMIIALFVAFLMRMFVL